MFKPSGLLSSARVLSASPPSHCGKFVKDYDPTIEDFYRRIVTVEGRACCLDILDTAGQDDFVTLRSTWMRGRDGFLFVYAVNDVVSFEEIRKFYKTLTDAYIDTARPPVVLLANKGYFEAAIPLRNERLLMLAFLGILCAFLHYYVQCDLTEQRCISAEQGAEFARSIEALFVETSAKTGTGIELAFATLVKSVKMDAPSTRAKRRAIGEGDWKEIRKRLPPEPIRRVRICTIL